MRGSSRVHGTSSSRARSSSGLDQQKLYLIGQGVRPVRFKRFPEPQSPWEALSSAFGVQSEAAQALVTLGGVMADPRAQAVLSRVETERMRGQGASVLADQPL